MKGAELETAISNTNKHKKKQLAAAWLRVIDPSSFF